MTKKSNAEYEEARKHALEILKKGFDLGFTPPRSRDEYYDRELDRKPSEHSRSSKAGSSTPQDHSS